MEKKYTVFVSSTYEDLKEERQEVMQALLEMDCIPCGMEIFPAASEEQFEFIKSMIDNCDYYVLILAGRYGSVNSSGVSYTELEFRYALEKNIPIISFVHGDIMSLPNFKCEKDNEKVEKFQLFVKEKLCKFWTSKEQLAGLVSRSMIQLIKRHPAIGWTRLSNSTTVCQFSDIVKLPTTLQEKINEAKKNVFISGVSLVSTLSTSFDYCIKNNIKVRLLMAYNNRDLIKNLAKLSYTTPEELIKHINTTITHFKSIGNLHNLKIRSIDAVVPLRLVGIDIGEPYGKIYVQQYLYKTNPATNPNYICYNGEELYNIYYQQIKSLWHDSIKIDF